MQNEISFLPNLYSKCFTNIRVITELNLGLYGPFIAENAVWTMLIVFILNYLNLKN